MVLIVSFSLLSEKVKLYYSYKNLFKKNVYISLWIDFNINKKIIKPILTTLFIKLEKNDSHTSIIFRSKTNIFLTKK